MSYAYRTVYTVVHLLDPVHWVLRYLVLRSHQPSSHQYTVVLYYRVLYMYTAYL